MAAIDPSQRLAIGAGLQTAGARERGVARKAERAAAVATGRAAGAVSAALQRRIAAIPAEDPDRPRKAVRLYLESALAREFGAGLLNDPGFPALLDAVQQRMLEDEHTAGAIEALGRLLVSGKVPPA